MSPNVRKSFSRLIAFLSLLGAAHTALATGYAKPVACAAAPC